jgi:hypothetical protein
MNKKLNKVLDAKLAKKLAQGCNLKVTLKKNYKGYSLYAIKNIKKGNVIAYYKFMIYADDDNFSGYKNNMYTMTVYNKNGSRNKTLIGDIYEGSLEYPKRGIPYWAYFSNEPSGDQTENCFIDINAKSNYRHRNKPKKGETLTYRLIASRNIKAGEEITWCYGGAYERDYESNCE